MLQMQRLTGVFCYQKKERKNSNKRIPISSWITIYQRKTGSPRPTKSRPRVKYSGFNFARGSESPFVHCTQPYRRAGNPPSSLHSDFVVVCQPLWCTTLSLAASLVSPYGLGTREHSSRYHGFACQPLRSLGTSRNGELST